MTIKEFFSLKKNRYFWFNLLAMIIVAIALVFVVLKALDTYTRHGQAIVVPDAKGMNVRQAEALFREKGLSSVVTDSTYVKEKPAGAVLEHNPQSGHKVKKGRVIYLTINTLSIPMQQVPDVADNSSLRQAQARVLAAGFKLAPHQTIHGEKDWVYGVKYNGVMLNPGDKAPIGATLTLVVGDGTWEEEELGEPDPDASSAPLSSEEIWF